MVTFLLIVATVVALASSAFCAASAFTRSPGVSSGGALSSPCAGRIS